ncbi:hypothetical protein H6762_00705 [Candidatus Nomurabacteria bacterium]|uniref:Uncharacterized protein n=1 Tax=Candidatus Dojkabacteria bacterium TaxID=2099670 RepID=A0A955I3P4_9BACT|nr:hypothetical protein [Candidatus Dojkabacteria bacterium]MCB9789496.1 hypothetical protein [Candidatus Nomurabacteria bacterium]
MQKKLSFKTYSIALGLGIIFTLLSLIVAQGKYGGMMYHERFGWPAQFYSVSRNIDWSELPSTPIPFNQSFNFIKGFVNVLVYSSVFYLIFNVIESIKAKKNQVIIISSFVLGLTLIMIFGFSIYNNVNTSVDEVPVDKLDSSFDQNDMDFDDNPIVFIDDETQLPVSDDVTLTDAKYNNGELLISLKYSGCSPHKFKLYIGSNWTDSEPSVVPVSIYHYSDGACEIMGESTERFSVYDLFNVLDKEVAEGQKLILSISDTSRKNIEVEIENSFNDSFSQEFAKEALLSAHPNISDEMNALPAKSLYFSRKDDHWTAVYTAEGSGVLQIFEAVCYKITGDGSVSELGQYKHEPYMSYILTDINNLDEETCTIRE